MPFIGLLCRPNLMLRIESMKVIARLLQIATPKQKEKIIEGRELLLIKKYLQAFPFNEATYFTLLEILLENVNNRGVANPLQNEEGEFFIRNPEILSVIFEMLCTTTGGSLTTLQHKVLQDFVFLLNQAENRSVLLRQPYWQNWLLGILANNSANQEVLKPVVKILTSLFHHSLAEPNGWKAFIETQGLLNFFGEQGFFQPVEVTRELNISMIRAITYDARIIQQSQRVPTMWENLTRWLSFAEECLFLTPQQLADANASSPVGMGFDDHFLLGIHRRWDGMWIDFDFAQKLLDFLDSLLLTQQTLDDINKPVQVNAQEDHLMRFALRLTLYTLFETDSFLNTDKIRERSTNLKNVENAVEAYFSVVATTASAKNTVNSDALAAYLQNKIKQWNGEMSSVDVVFQKNVERLRQIVHKLITKEKLAPSAGTSVEVNRLMYIVSFLYRAVKRSYEHQGIGAELILTIFKEILIASKLLLPLAPELMSMSDDQFVDFFMRHFTYPDENSILFKQFDDGVMKVLLEEHQYCHFVSNSALEQKNQTIEQVQRLHAQEQTLQSQLEAKFMELDSAFRFEESERLGMVQRSLVQLRRSLMKKTRSILNELGHERGPWATPETINQAIFWKASKTEDPLRRRMKSIRNRHFNSYDQCTKGGAPVESSLPQQPLNIAMLSKLEFKPAKSFSQPLIEEPPSPSRIQPQEQPPPGEDDEDEDDHGIGEEEAGKIVFACDCDLITPMQVTPARFELTKINIYIVVTKVKFCFSFQKFSSKLFFNLTFCVTTNFSLIMKKPVLVICYILPPPKNFKYDTSSIFTLEDFYFEVARLRFSWLIEETTLLTSEPRTFEIQSGRKSCPFVLLA